MTTFFEKRRQIPHLNKILDFDSIDQITDASNFYRLVKTMIKKATLTNKASVSLMLYFIFQREDASDALLRLSLFTEFCLRQQDNQYFDMLKDLIEDYFANGRPTTSQICHVIGLIRKIAQCEKTEYSAKLLDLVQGVLGLLNEREF